MEIITEILMILLGIPIYFSWKLTQYRLINTWIDDLQFFSPRRVFIPQGVRVRMHTPVGYCNSFHFFQDKVCSFYDADVVILYNFSCRFSLRHTFIISTTFLNKKNTQSAVQNPGKQLHDCQQCLHAQPRTSKMEVLELSQEEAKARVQLGGLCSLPKKHKRIHDK